jgi:hypothetical protein
VSLREALADPNLLGHALQGDSWQSWRALLFAALGEPLSDDERVIFKRLTGREREPGVRVDELAAVVGRRGGKSRALATLAVYVAAPDRHAAVLARGERRRSLLLKTSAARASCSIIAGAVCRLADAALARRRPQRHLSRATPRPRLEVRWASFRALRGPSYLAVLADELAYWWPEDGGYANPDVEVLNAARRFADYWRHVGAGVVALRSTRCAV